MGRFFFFIVVASITLSACKKENNSLIVGSWKRTGSAEVADWNTPVTGVTFTPTTGCLTEDVYTYTSGGKYSIRNEGTGCPFTATYNYSYNAGSAELVLEGMSSSTSTVVELNNTQMILKSRVTGAPGVEASWRKFVRL